MTDRAQILATAEEAINGERARSYGDAAEGFGVTGALWGTILGTEPIPAEIVALMLIALKVSRLTVSPSHEDSWVDVAGYAALGGEIGTEHK